MGIVDFSSAVDLDHVLRMSERIAHRGPDDHGYYAEPGVALVGRRLAIIDLSSAGRQPMADETGRYELLFNGEIYNYRELRADLRAKRYQFRTETDTEVLLAAYREWGEQCVERLNGMWAIAIWDAEERRLFCSRDRFGEKPFYYHQRGGRLTFASELKAFQHGERRFAANHRVVRDFVAHGLVDHSDETFFSDIRQLSPAHSLTFSASGLRTSRYWQLEPRDPPSDPVDSIRELFLDSVRLRLRSDVPVGTCLSGGLDSSAVVGAVDRFVRTDAESARPIGERQRTFTAYFEDPAIDERPYANAVIQRVAAEPYFVTFSGRGLLEVLPSVVYAQDEPFRSTSIVAQWYVMREARQAGLKVMLDGQGGDELFAGYDGYLGYFFANLLLEGRWFQLAGELTAQRKLRSMSRATLAAALIRPFVPPALAWRLRAKLNGSSTLLHPDITDAHRSFSAPHTENAFPDRFRRQLHVVLATRLPELLHYEDRNSMTHSLEARLPFLDHRLAELAFSLHALDVIRCGKTKFALREAVGGLLPRVVRDRVDKLGFATPEDEWFRGALGDLAEDVFHSRAFIERGFIEPKAARDRLHRHRRGELSAGSELWRALCLELWATTFLDQAHGSDGADRRKTAAPIATTDDALRATAGQHDAAAAAGSG